MLLHKIITVIKVLFTFKVGSKPFSNLPFIIFRIFSLSIQSVKFVFCFKVRLTPVWLIFLTISINYCGQSYNYEGHPSGVHARIWRCYSRTIYMPCASQNLNLVLSD